LTLTFGINGWTDGQTDGGDCITSHANAVGDEAYPAKCPPITQKRHQLQQASNSV